jgi:predicted dehydrogenase
MPVVEDEAGTYGYTLENKHMVEAFRSRRMPDETFADGVEVVRMIMAAYRSAELGQVVDLPDDDLMNYTPLAARELV